MKEIYNADCMQFMSQMKNESVDLTLTDIPYNEVNKKKGHNQLRNLDKGKADVLTFDLEMFCNEVFRVTKGTIIIFCGYEQFSKIFSNFSTRKSCTTRCLVWQKSNPSVMNGKYIYLNGVELAVWCRKSNASFNAYCKNTVFKYPIGSNKLHPTEKNHKLLKELILDNSNENDLVFDCCFGSGSTLLVAKELNRRILGCELDNYYYNLVSERFNEVGYMCNCAQGELF